MKYIKFIQDSKINAIKKFWRPILFISRRYKKIGLNAGTNYETKNGLPYARQQEIKIR